MKSSSHTHRSASSSPIRLASVLLAWLTFTGLTTAAVLPGAMPKEWPAKVMIAGFGMNEAFGGAAGLADFRAQFGAYLDQIARLHPGAKLVLLSPTALERGGQVLEVERRNRDVAAYAQVIGEAAP